MPRENQSNSLLDSQTQNCTLVYQQPFRGFVECFLQILSQYYCFIGLSADAAAYITANPYDSGNWEESIGIQKYIALFHNGHEAWTEARRLGVPELATAVSNGVANPKRMIYPVEEVLINTTNYNEAESAMGGDETTSPIFWDVD